MKIEMHCTACEMIHFSKAELYCIYFIKRSTGCEFYVCDIIVYSFVGWTHIKNNRL